MLRSYKLISRLLTVCLVLLLICQYTNQHPICKPSHEYWSSELSSCINCTKCAPEFTISPCAIDKNSVCGPLSALELDWSFLKNRRKTNNINLQLNDDNNHPESLKKNYNDNLSHSSINNDYSQFDDLQKLQILPEVPNDRQIDDSYYLPWDWQTSVLVLAVIACIIFFMVAGCSALIYVRQWRQMKRNFEPAGLEEISARLNLMVKAELAELSAGAPMSPGDPETRCQYLEKLLDRKRETPVLAGWPETGGNLYIEAGETPKTSRNKRAQIAQIHRNIESILSHKNIQE
ncbi:hypothetical protein HCN44_008752 [Aphidius gifuensis]|nr:tumor necrosis factor receptor superfamily member wengen-like [Aphidius gifuensis]XP_044012859.1 tumor necrosis factor receptor superfamily member wengen-like [Aphidius gifuensis]KAF7991440.1 hypothetical protein HCN44_008752 [Aphidius gifuensis]